ncbi:hypothetical protein I4F81_002886 [Pyropia yezoensis]|uniref:Uncharacterized protein n=1 Tax=Pyropia yezoensis TaxID=2788 RepID=A0ACC3BQX8_PYRYE|nr:hypothetical protein I4F81_002886 [Neopyropia yezoensis]
MRRLAYDEFTSSAPTTGVTPGASASGAPGGGGGRAKADGGSAGGVRAYDPKGLTRGAVGRKPTGDEPAPQTLLVVRGAVRVAAYVPVWARRTLTRRPKAVDEGGRWPGIRLTRKRRRAGGEGGVDAAVNALLEPDLSAAADLDAVRMLEDD